MGIRMNVAVGWGLNLTDRNRAGLSFNRLESEEVFEAWKVDVVTYAKEHDDIMEKLTFHNVKQSADALYQLVMYDDEFGHPDRALLLPNGYQRQWHRYGDLLDIYHYEATHDPEDWGQTEWIEKPGTLYPFVGLMRANPDEPLGYETYWESCFLESKKHKKAIPVAPAHLWFLIKHLKLTKAGESVTDAFLSLRPTIYRWFS